MSAPASSFYRCAEQGLFLHLRVTPNAGRDAIEGVDRRDDGTSVLRVRVAAVADRGRANAAAIALIAKALDLPRSAIDLASGQTSRFKTLLISSPMDDLAVRVAALGD